MNRPSTAQDPAVAAAVAEASAWLVLLHGPRRTPAAERGFHEWLAESALHRKAFESATDVWNQRRAAIRSAAQVKFIVPGVDKTSTQPRIALAAAAALLLAVVGVWYYAQRSNVTTRVGEQRNLALEDGTQVSLNTATRLIVDYSDRERRVRLEAGEALFDVAKHPGRPFVVTVGDREITALGTAFLVRRDGQSVAVTLVNGKVAVALEGRASGDSFLLAPGERLTFSSGTRAPKMDRPALAKLTAWQQGRVQIDNLTLKDAIVEMNRYNTVQLAVKGEQAAKMRLSGMFRIGDARNFADAVARTHGLEVTDEGRRIVLSGMPHEANEAYFESESAH